MRADNKPPRMTDIARVVGVSPMTVSRAFRNDGTVSQKTRDAVMSAAEGMGYVFDSTAAALRLQRTGFVAVIIPSINNANFSDTLRGLTDGLKGQGLQILLGYTDYDIQKEEDLIEQLLRRRPEAIVVTGGTHTPRARKLLSGAGIPVVEMWDLPKAPICHVVGFSNAAAMGGLVDHCVEAGLSRIAFIGGDINRDTRGADRRHGFVAAMRRYGMDADRLVGLGHPPVSMREGAEAMAQLLDTRPDTQAVICVSDLAAFGALTECQRRGINVPGKIWIAGFGNYEVAGVCVPTLTTVDPLPNEIGHQVAVLVGRALTGVLDGTKTISIAHQLVLRQSTAVAPTM
ncbi:MAG: LacI family DNA-binding transcriptional regulator [Paracoccaceae bacterium]